MSLKLFLKYLRQQSLNTAIVTSGILLVHRRRTLEVGEMWSRLSSLRPLSNRLEWSATFLKNLQGSNRDVAGRTLCTQTVASAKSAGDLKETEKATGTKEAAVIEEATGEGWTWVEANKIFYGPKRDFANYPIPKWRQNTPPIRHGFIPETFFQGFYDRTGVSGGYAFIAGLSTYLISKEIIVYDSSALSYMLYLTCGWFVYFKVFKYYGVPEFINKRVQRTNDALFEPVENIAKNCQKQLDAIEEEKKSFDTDVYFYQAAEEYFDLIREYRYRETLQDFSQAVKDRLDFHYEMENIKVKFEQEIMVDWIKTGVLKNITPQLENDTLKTCIGTLRELSTKQVG